MKQEKQHMDELVKVSIHSSAAMIFAQKQESKAAQSLKILSFLEILT